MKTHAERARGHHDNSKEAHTSTETRMSGRRLAIFRHIALHGPATDRQLRDALFPGGDMNMIRPRVSELLDMGALVETGRATCPTTGMTVRVVDLADRV